MGQPPLRHGELAAGADGDGGPEELCAHHGPQPGAHVARGRLPYLQILGDDYNTPDGTGVRDYIHVQDLAAGHIKALEALEETQSFAVNLGTGQGYSVMEMLRAFEKASGKDIPIEVLPRRAGDIASSYADTKMAKDLLGWSAELDIQNMCEDSWNWANKNPTGYGSKPY